MKKRVLATGVFDLLHIGHIHFLSGAKKQGDHLIVLITCDEVAKRQKREPFNSQAERALMLKSLAMVDEVIIGQRHNDYNRTLNEINPDIIVLGYDQDSSWLEHVKKTGWNGEAVILSKYSDVHYSTTRILEKIRRS